ncbi:fimbrial protein [Pseudomonas sp. NPDC090755]|uniref:fimbrial protein n=1 Tax=Pseudomonas sp. NPDC090755 TaxID=3364481 RepID=UPI00383A7154
MKKSIIGFALSLPLLAGMSLTAQANDGQIDFTGSIGSSTCIINGGAGGQNFTVALKPAQRSELAATGQTAQPEPFQIRLSECTPAAGRVDISFPPGPQVDPTTGRLNLLSGGAQNVQLQLLNSASQPIRIGAAPGSQDTIPVDLSAGAATLDYTIRYFATGAATAGAANSNVQYLIRFP